MHFIAGAESLDTVSTDGNCLYKPTPLGADIPGVPFTSPNVLVNKAPLAFYAGMLSLPNGTTPPGGATPGTVTPTKINPLPPIGLIPCAPGIRTIIPTANKTVFINGKLVAVQGDQTLIVGSTGIPMLRNIIGPFTHMNVMVESPLTDDPDFDASRT